MIYVTKLIKMIKYTYILIITLSILNALRAVTILSDEGFIQTRYETDVYFDLSDLALSYPNSFQENFSNSFNEGEQFETWNLLDNSLSNIASGNHVLSADEGASLLKVTIGQLCGIDSKGVNQLDPNTEYEIFALSVYNSESDTKVSQEMSLGAVLSCNEEPLVDYGINSKELNIITSMPDTENGLVNVLFFIGAVITDEEGAFTLNVAASGVTVRKIYLDGIVASRVSVAAEPTNLNLPILDQADHELIPKSASLTTTTTANQKLNSKYTEWIGMYSNSGAEEAMTDDIDNDGVDNLSEFLLGTNPSVHGDPIKDSFEIDRSTSGNKVYYTAQQRGDASRLGLSYSMEYCQDLSANIWTDDGPLKFERVGNLADGYRPIIYGVDSDVAATGFMRLKAKVESETQSAAVSGYPADVRHLRYESEIDNTLQSSLMYVAKSDNKRPLLVGLHTWSSDYRQTGGEIVYARWAYQNGWHFVHPNFRGPNSRPKAMGSEYAVSDIISVVNYMKENYKVDEDRIYLIGVSGGAYAALLMAGRYPDVWAGVSSWCPITNIRTWWEQTKDGPNSRYADHIEAAVGGRPDTNTEAAAECVARSANNYLHLATNVNLDINHGVNDGRTGSVPFTHSLYAFNTVAAVEDRLDTTDIEDYYTTQVLPASMAPSDSDPLYGNKDALFRKISNNARVTIFNGTHEIVQTAALNWLSQQRKGVEAKWEIPFIYDLVTTSDENRSGM